MRPYLTISCHPHLCCSIDDPPQSAAEAADNLAANLPGQQQTLAEKDAFIQSSASNLTSLRTAAHQLSEDNKAERQRVAEAKAKVDEARLALENKRLEEMELQEEIRRESSE